MKIKLLVASLLTALFASEVQAGSVYQYTHIKRFYPSGTSVFLIPEEGVINPAGCSKATSYLMKSDHINFEDYKKIMLGAKLSNLKVGVYVRDDECVSNYPSLYRMFIQ